jgi:hypothetical protein
MIHAMNAPNKIDTKGFTIPESIDTAMIYFMFIFKLKNNKNKKYTKMNLTTNHTLVATNYTLTTNITSTNLTEYEYTYNRYIEDTYICLRNRQDYCLGISTGDGVPNSNYYIQAKSKSKNEAKGTAWKRMKWDIDFGNGEIFLHNFPEYKLSVNKNQLYLTKSPSDVFWEFTDPGGISMRSTDRCISVMTCKAFKTREGNSYCSVDSKNALDNIENLEYGTYINMKRCEDKFSQNFKTKEYCFDNCLQEMIGDGTCDMACNNDLCDFDLGDCASEVAEYEYYEINPTNTSTTNTTSSPLKVPTSSPFQIKNNTLSPTYMPTATLAPTVMPSVLPTFLPSDLPSFDPTLTPSKQPFSDEVGTTDVMSPTSAPTQQNPYEIMYTVIAGFIIFCAIVLCCVFVWLCKTPFDKKNTETDQPLIEHSTYNGAREKVPTVESIPSTDSVTTDDQAYVDNQAVHENIKEVLGLNNTDDDEAPQTTTTRPLPAVPETPTQEIKELNLDIQNKSYESSNGQFQSYLINKEFSQKFIQTPVDSPSDVEIV